MSDSDKKIIVPAKLRKEATSMSFMLPHFIIFCVFFVFPFVFGLIISLYDWNLYNSAKTSFAGFGNFRKILFDSDSIFYTYFWKGLGNTVFFVVISVPLLIIIPLFLALLLDMQPWGHRIFSAILFMPTVFSVSSVILMWRNMFGRNNGFFNGILAQFNVEGIAFLAKQPWAWVAIVVTTVWWTIGTNMVILHAGMKNINRSMYEAAAIDGASYFRTVMKITIPSLGGQMLIVMITTVLGSFNIYGQPRLLTNNGGPNQSTFVLMMRIRDWSTGVNAKPGIATAMAICVGVIMMAISFSQAYFMKKRGRG